MSARYTKIMVDKYRLHEKSIRKKSLYAHLLFEISMRAKRSTGKDFDGKEQWEFYLSETEYDKFGLKRSQKWQINRAIDKFIRANFIEKVEWKIGSKWGYVYRVLDWCPVQPSFQNEEQSREWIGNWQRTSRDEISKKKYPNKKISEMDFEEQVQNYDPSRHDEFVQMIWVDATHMVKKDWFKQYK